MHQHKFQTKAEKVTNLPREASSDINRQQPGLVLNDLVSRCFNSSYLPERNRNSIFRNETCTKSKCKHCYSCKPVAQNNHVSTKYKI